MHLLYTDPIITVILSHSVLFRRNKSLMEILSTVWNPSNKIKKANTLKVLICMVFLNYPVASNT